MTPNQFRDQMGRLSKAQQKVIREKFSGRVPDIFHVDAETSKVTVQFGRVVHWVMLGPRGKVIYSKMGVI